MKQDEEALHDAFRVRFRLADDPERLENDVEEFFRQHREQWIEAPTSFDGPENAFQRDFIAIAFERGWLRLCFLVLDGRSAASVLNYRFGGVEYGYQLARDRSLDRFSVGSITLAYSLRAALEDGVRELRFLRGDEDYKTRYATCNRGLETVGLARGPAGHAALLGLNGYLRLRRGARRLRGR